VEIAQKTEHRKAGSLVAASAGGAISASNFLQREFYPALQAAELLLASTTIPPGAVHRILRHTSFATR